MESELNLSFDKKKDWLALGFFKAILQDLRYNKDKVRISNLLLSIKFKRSLPLKFIEKAKQIRSLA